MVRANPSSFNPWLVRIWVAACLLFGGGLIASGFYSQSHGKRQIAGIDAQVTKTSSSNNTLPQSQAQFRAIEEIRVGDRVKTDVPEEVWATDFLDLDEESALAGPDVDPASWRLLRMSGETYEDGKLIDDHQIETLQHISWVQAYNVTVGLPCPVPLNLEEMDSDPHLLVKATAILPCPPIKPGKGRIVLTTVNHFNTDVWKVVVENENGQRETIEPTGRHPFYSATRQTAVATQDLEVGETLVGTDFDGEGEPERLTVISLARDPGKHRVYNLTVQGEHVYRVSMLGALVHNTCFDDHHGTPRQIIKNATAKDGVSPMDIMGKKGMPNRIKIPHQDHMDAHNGRMNGLPRYNVEFENRLAALRTAAAKGLRPPVDKNDYWNIRQQMLYDYFRIGTPVKPPVPPTVP